jgi:hypothetical protein
MCMEPTTAMLALQIGSSLLGFAAESQQADSTNARNATARLQIANARDEKVRSQILKQNQETDAKVQEKIDNNVNALELSDKAQLSAAEAGVSGRVVNAIMTKYERDRLTTNTTLSSDIDRIGTQGALDRSGIESEAQSMINKYQPVAKPSVMGLAMDIGLAVAGHEVSAAEAGKSGIFYSPPPLGTTS